MFIYTHLSRRGVRLPLPRHPLAKLLLGVVAVTLGLVVAVLAVIAGLMWAVFALGASVVRGGRRTAKPMAPSTAARPGATGRAVSPSPAPGAGPVEDVRFRELP